MPLRQPWKFLYFIYLATKVIFVKLPYWTLLSIPRSQRPRSSWSLGRCLRIYLFRTVLGLPLKLGIFSGRDMTLEVPDSELPNSRFVWVEGVDEKSIQGPVRVWAKIANVKPTRIPGFWQFKKGISTIGTLQAKDDEKVVYHLHGGAYVVGSAHPSEPTALIPSGIFENSTTISRSFALDYRLSASAPFPAKDPFPSALLDSIAGYQYLIDLGFKPENIILSGDSAGGNLALTLSRYLVKDAVPNLAPPGRLLVFSPWGDLSSSEPTPTSSRIANEASDIFSPRFSGEGLGSYGATSYLGSTFGPNEAKSNEYISPASAYLAKMDGMFKGFPRTFISAGSAEILLDDAIVIAERIRADNPSDGWVTLDVVEDAVHDFILFPWFEPERSDALVRISRWIDEDQVSGI